jgi:probable 2-oxoglutarate dehydrogenase E1 component DHKTD1
MCYTVTSVDIKVNEGNVHFSILPNPSHLETVNPMAAGKARAKMKTLKDYDYSKSSIEKCPRVLCVQVNLKL